MPEIVRIAGFRFFFFSREGIEPRHVHVEQAERYAKFWLEPRNAGRVPRFPGAELRELHSLVAQNREKFIFAWDEHFGQ